MKTVISAGRNYLLREARDEDVPSLRRLINAAYGELAEMGLNYTGTYQDEETTRERISGGRAFVLEDESGGLVVTALVSRKNEITGRDSAYISQLAVSPSLKKCGLGRLLMDHCESVAREDGFSHIQLDTAQPAAHLVEWYRRRGYRIVGEVRWSGKTYSSWIFELELKI